jgi:virulence factor Mce-like protein
MISAVADRLVALVRYGHRKRAWLSALGLVLVLVIASGYLLFGALRLNPFASTYRVTIALPNSGGLLPRQNAAVRGFRVGRVETLHITPDGVNAVVRLDARNPIPANSAVRVSGLSPAGEQYVDFLPDTTEGPFLKNGDVIELGRAVVPKTLDDTLTNSDGALKQLDTAKLDLMKKELSMSKEGPQKLADIVDGGTFLLTTLDSVMPETTNLLRTSRVVLNLAADKGPGMVVAADNLNRSFAGINKMLNGYRTLNNVAPKTLSSVDDLFADNSDTMVQLLGSLTTTTQLLYLRVPALHALFPDYRTSLFDAIGSTMKEGGLWASGDIYPRYACDYGTPRRPPSSADYPEPYMYTYCRDEDPAVLIRGAKNAPRPAGDDTAGPPAGADLGKTTDPTPKGRYTIPTPYGGPTLPMEPPH